MAAHPIVSRSYHRRYTREELEASARSITDALAAVDDLTGEQLEGVAFQFRPKTEPELLRTLENLEAALEMFEREIQNAPDVRNIRSRFFDFSTRHIE